MDRTVVEVPGISEGIRKAGVPLSPVIKANGFVFVSGIPPIDLATGAFAKGDIATQTELSLKAVQRAPGACLGNGMGLRHRPLSAG